jgi:hypothetical protein
VYTLDSIISANTNVSGSLTTTSIDSNHVNDFGDGVLTATSITADTLTIGGTGTAYSVPEPATLALFAVAGVGGRDLAALAPRRFFGECHWF